MQYSHFNYNAFELWELCTNTSDSQSQEIFWSDIVLHLKANSGHAVFFENLFKELKIIDEQNTTIKEPLDVVSKKLIAFAVYFDSDFWSKIIKNWAKINIELKIRTQTALLQNSELIKEFLMSVLDEQKNPKTTINSIAKESGLLKKYTKNDVILMLCYIIAESFEDYQTNDKEIKSVMNDGIFQMADEVLETDNLEHVEQKIEQTQPIIVDMQKDNSKKQLKDICEEFIAQLQELSTVDHDWQIVGQYLDEARKIATTKDQKRQEIFKRRKLVDEFTIKLNYFKDAFCVQLDSLSIQMPCVNVIDDLDNNSIELSTQNLTTLQDLMNKYKNLSQEKSSNISQEKKRLGLLYTVMTDIEAIVQTFQEKLNAQTLPKETILADAPEQEQTIDEAPKEQLLPTVQEQSLVVEQTQEQIEQQQEEQQIDLFTTKL